jgi:hypothetical protein
VNLIQKGRSHHVETFQDAAGCGVRHHRDHAAADSGECLGAVTDQDPDRRAADEAAVREIDVPHYVETGEIRFSGNEYALAEQYANANADYLHARQIAIVIQSIAVDEAADTVRVSALADVSALFPAIAPQVNIRREGTAQVRLTAR